MKQKNLMNKISLTLSALFISISGSANDLMLTSSQKNEMTSNSSRMNKIVLEQVRPNTSKETKAALANESNRLFRRNQELVAISEANYKLRLEAIKSRSDMQLRQVEVAKANAPWAYKHAGKMSLKLIGPGALIGMGAAAIVHSGNSSEEAEQLVKLSNHKLRSAQSNSSSTQQQVPSSEPVQRTLGLSAK